ncbi:MAG: hypothetical protein ABWY64_27390 [Tardiphaga sp.]
MTSWMEERDLLVATTLAFVQEVAAAHPGTIAADKSPDRTSDTDGVPRPPALVGAVQQTATSLPAGTGKTLAAMVSEREHITQRVASFRARQGQIIAEREAYYETMKARIKTVLGNESSGRRL